MLEETIFGFQARAALSFRQQIEAKEAELTRAKRALRLEAAKLADARRRMRAVQHAINEILESYRGRGASAAAYIAILAQGRIAKALAGERYPDEVANE